MIKDPKTVKLHSSNSPLASVNMGDMYYMGPGMKNKIGKEGKSAWDTCSSTVNGTQCLSAH